MRRLHLAMLLSTAVVMFGCKTTPDPVLSQAKNESEIGREPTVAECQRYYTQWKELHPNGVLSPSQVGYPMARKRMSFCPLADEQIEVMRRHTAEFDHRLWHIRWHAIRSIWNNEQFKDIRKFVQDNYPEWVVNESNYFGAQYRNATQFPNNKQGIDFLYMHKMMFDMLNEALAKAGLPPAVGWTVIPKGDSALFPVPKDDQYYPHSTRAETNITNWESLYQTGAYMRSVTLSQMGYDLETTIHNLMHMRFAVRQHPAEMEGDMFKRWEEYSSDEQDKMRYDGPGDANFYDWLGDPFSSAINPQFWKLHGWINDRLEQWMNLHQNVCVTGHTLPEGHNPSPCETTYNLTDLFVGALPIHEAPRSVGHDGHLGAPPPTSRGKSLPTRMAGTNQRLNEFARTIFLSHIDPDAGAEGDNFRAPRVNGDGVAAPAAVQPVNVPGLGGEMRAKEAEFQDSMRSIQDN